MKKIIGILAGALVFYSVLSASAPAEPEFPGAPGEFYYTGSQRAFAGIKVPAIMEKYFDFATATSSDDQRDILLCDINEDKHVLVATWQFIEAVLCGSIYILHPREGRDVFRDEGSARFALSEIGRWISLLCNDEQLPLCDAELVKAIMNRLFEPVRYFIASGLSCCDLSHSIARVITSLLEPCMNYLNPHGLWQLFEIKRIFNCRSSSALSAALSLAGQRIEFRKTCLQYLLHMKSIRCERDKEKLPDYEIKAWFYQERSVASDLSFDSIRLSLSDKDPFERESGGAPYEFFYTGAQRAFAGITVPEIMEKYFDFATATSSDYQRDMLLRDINEDKHVLVATWQFIEVVLCQSIRLLHSSKDGTTFLHESLVFNALDVIFLWLFHLCNHEKLPLCDTELAKVRLQRFFKPVDHFIVHGKRGCVLSHSIARVITSLLEPCMNYLNPHGLWQLFEIKRIFSLFPLYDVSVALGMAGLRTDFRRQCLQYLLHMKSLRCERDKDALPDSHIRDWFDEDPSLASDLRFDLIRLSLSGEGPADCPM